MNSITLPFVADIAKNLPGKWEAGPLHPNSEYPVFCVRNPAGVTLYFRLESDRLKVSHSAPSRPHHLGAPHVEVRDEKWNRVECSSITVSPDKKPEVIARDIAKRMLAQAEIVTTRALETIQKEQAEYDARIVTVQRVTAAAGVPMRYEFSHRTPGGPGEPDPNRPEYRYYVGKKHHSLEVRHSSTVHLELSMTADEAEKALRALRELGII